MIKTNLLPEEKVKKVGKIFKSKSADEIVAFLQNVAASSTAKNQLDYILVAEEALTRFAPKLQMGGRPTLHDAIITQQFHACEKYGANLYPLSEKQLGVIARQFEMDFKLYEA